MSKALISKPSHSAQCICLIRSFSPQTDSESGEIIQGPLTGQRIFVSALFVHFANCDPHSFERRFPTNARARYTAKPVGSFTDEVLSYIASIEQSSENRD